jgi:hypothetical protein
MKPYRNLAGDSGVEAYETGPDSITVQFRGAGVYVYDHATTGREAVARMKRLASAGRGLSTFIARYVKDRYASKRD